jgi:hypothetical protein
VDDGVWIAKIHRLFLATKGHKGTQRKKEYLNHTNETFLVIFFFAFLRVSLRLKKNRGGI